MNTVSLQMIVKDEADQVNRILEDALPYFDQINLTVSDKPTANKLSKAAEKFNAIAPKGKSVNVQYREWNDKFDDARNANYAMSTTDFTFWLDADDSFDFKKIPQLLAYAAQLEYDAIFLPYNYAYDPDGNVIAKHYRERLVRNGKGFTWRGWVHETYISDQDYTSTKLTTIPVNHNTSKEHAHESLERNHKILEKAYKETEDPRYLLYYGMSLYSHEEYDKAAEKLSDYLEVGKSVEDTYRAISVISECAYHLKRYDMALEWATKAITMKPEYPQGYWLLAQYEADQQNWFEALEWVKVSLTKPDPDSLSVYDPSARERAILIAAQADFMLGNYNNALIWLKKIPNNRTAETLMEDFLKEADAETFVSLLPRFRQYFVSDTSLWESLCHDIKFDKRVKTLRRMATDPRKWDDKSIVIFCGQGYEEWGPHTIDKGMGGSEESIVYLAPELARLGYDVTVYGEAQEEQMVSDKDTINYVHWKKWQEIDTRDEFNVFVSWRAPQYLENVNAKVKIADIHDVLPSELIKDYPDVTYLFKTQYHKDLYKPVESAVIGNGIKKDQFHE